MAPKKKAGATSPSAEDVQPTQPVAAVHSEKKGAQSASVSRKSDVATTNKTSDHTMTSENENILSYGEDIADAEAPPPLPDGEYPAEIRNATTAVSKTSGNTMVPVTIHISPDDYPSDYPVEFNPDGVTLTSYRLIYDDTVRGRFRMKKFCEAIGATTGKHINPSDWIGKKVLVTVGHEEYEGEQRNNIQKFSPVD